MYYFSFLLVFVYFTDPVNSLICETCDGSTCFDRDRWIQELCPPSTQFCYRLALNGKGFRRGCTDFPCSQLPGVEAGMECQSCSNDRCNNERDNFSHQNGGGLTWKFSTKSHPNLMILVFMSYLLIN